jgi:hypothetical protein
MSHNKYIVNILIYIITQTCKLYQDARTGSRCGTGSGNYRLLFSRRSEMNGTKSFGLRIAVGFLLATALHCSVSAQTASETTGPYKVVMEVIPSLPNHTVYRPENLTIVKGKLPVVAFGNGACANAGNAFQNYLAETASYGFIVVANGPIDLNMPTPAQLANLTRAMENAPKTGPGGGAGQIPRMPMSQSKTSQLYETMDWAKAQNEDKASLFYSKLDTSAVAVMGQSCGGLQALEAASDPRVKTAVILNSGIIRNMSAMPGRGASTSGMPPMVLPGSVESLGKLHSPTIYIIGGEKDIAYKNAEADFAEIKNVPLFKTNLDVGHGGTLVEPHGGKFAETATQWLLWQLKGDQQAGQTFVGDNCGLCRQAEWKVERKNMK